jgi:hypothetical protein
LVNAVVQLFSFLSPRIVFALDPRAKEPLLALFFLKLITNFSLSLTILIQELQITIHKVYLNVAQLL